MQEFSEWAQCQVLEFVSHYTAADAAEVYDIMNALDDRLATPNSAVVLATVKVFLNLTILLPYDHQQVCACSLVSCPQLDQIFPAISLRLIPWCLRNSAVLLEL